MTSPARGGSFHITLYKGSFDSAVNRTLLMSVQVERRSPQHHYRARHTLDGAKMRASVRMTRYLESWGAAKPFANLHHRDSMTNENGKINTAVCHFFFLPICCDITNPIAAEACNLSHLFFPLPLDPSRMCQWDSFTSRGDQKGKLFILEPCHQASLNSAATDHNMLNDRRPPQATV